MSIGPAIVYDKSAIQRLSRDEAYWLSHFFRGVMTPVFMAEVLGNLAKDFRGRNDPEQMVAAFADKTTGLGTMPNINHTELVVANLLGHFVEMAGRPLVGGGRRITAENGETGVFIDEPPEAKAFRRWSERKFGDEDRAWAGRWRADLKKLDLTSLPKAVKYSKEQRLNVDSLEKAALVVATFLCDPSERYRSFHMAFEILGVPANQVRSIYERWVACERPILKDYAPYAYFALLVTMTFLVAVSLRLVPDRSTNLIDLQYLYYLPFCKIFTSGDKLHRDLAPLFMRADQKFIWIDELQDGLQKLTVHYAGLDEATKATGTMRYARHPPLEMTSAVHEAFDFVMPGWRESALEPPVEITPERNAEIMKRLKPMMDAIKAAS